MRREESENREIDEVRQPGVVVKDVSVEPVHDPHLFVGQKLTIDHGHTEAHKDPEEQDDEVLCVGLARTQVPPA